MKMSHDYLGIEDTLDEDDYAVVIGKDGSLKGLYIPTTDEEAEVPESVCYFLKKYWGIDANDPATFPTIH
jgi:hypothetical protein